jgi:hypothetical protein
MHAGEGGEGGEATERATERRCVEEEAGKEEEVGKGEEAGNMKGKGGGLGGLLGGAERWFGGRIDPGGERNGEAGCARASRESTVTTVEAMVV